MVNTRLHHHHSPSFLFVSFLFVIHTRVCNFEYVWTNHPDATRRSLYGGRQVMCEQASERDREKRRERKQNGKRQMHTHIIVTRNITSKRLPDASELGTRAESKWLKTQCISFNNQVFCWYIHVYMCICIKGRMHTYAHIRIVIKVAIRTINQRVWHMHDLQHMQRFLRSLCFGHRSTLA